MSPTGKWPKSAHQIALTSHSRRGARHTGHCSAAVDVADEALLPPDTTDRARGDVSQLPAAGAPRSARTPPRMAAARLRQSSTTVDDRVWMDRGARIDRRAPRRRPPRSVRPFVAGLPTNPASAHNSLNALLVQYWR